MKTMTTKAFKDSLGLSQPPGGLTSQEEALWWAGKGDWNKAHHIVQDLPDSFSARIHAFLHRQEGDLSNARYWYDRAGSQMPATSIDQEWDDLVESH
jgi:hypothetical protein